jgi:hypothetical protein
MASAIGWLYMLIGIAGTVDALVHPQSNWVHAERNKPFWIVMMLVFSIFAVLPYLIGVRPLLHTESDRAYQKD